MKKRVLFYLLITALFLAAMLFTVSCGGTPLTSSTSPSTSISASTSLSTSTTTATSQPEPSDAWNPDGIIGDDEYTGRAQYGNYEISWSSDDTSVYIGIRAKTDGWVAVGFGAASGMLNADIVLGSVRDGQAAVTDQYSTGTFGPHSPDVELGGSDDVSLSGGLEEGGFTTIEFTRLLNTGDRYDKAITGGRVDIIWSYGSTDDFDRQHVTRGSGELDL